VAYPCAGSCRRMPCQTGISGRSSSRGVGLSGPLLGSVGVKIGVKGRSQIGCLPVHGHVASDHDGPHGIAGCVRPVGACHFLLPGLDVASEEDAGRAVDQEDGNLVVVGLEEELASRKRDDVG
jgi:hypothetical protein